MTTHHIVAIDGGGTACRARVYDAALASRGEGFAGLANLLVGDGSEAIASIRSAVGAALADAGLGDDPDGLILSAALAGATETGRARFFAARWPMERVRLLSDVHAAVLGAHGGQDGGVVVVGTGIAAGFIMAGRFHAIGGWGFAVDDLGSGADIGRRALRAALRRLDEKGDAGPSACLGARILGRFDGSGAAASWAAGARPADFGALAPVVFECAEAGDPEARQILDHAVDELDRLVGLALRAGSHRVAVVGSVGRRLAPQLRSQNAAHLVEPEGDALLGAALAARLGQGWSA